jgi:hypothetical protein
VRGKLIRVFCSRFSLPRSAGEGAEREVRGGWGALLSFTPPGFGCAQPPSPKAENPP